MLISYVIYKKCTLVGRGGVGEEGRFLQLQQRFKSAGTALRHPYGAGPDHSAEPGVPAANVVNTAIKMFVLILTSESQLINKKGSGKLKNKLNAAVGLAGSQQHLTASFNFSFYE